MSVMLDACNCFSGHLYCRLSPQALADLCVARQLYSSTVMRIKQQRQLLVLQLAQIIDSFSGMQQYATDNVINNVAGEGPMWCCVEYFLCLCCLGASTSCFVPESSGRDAGRAVLVIHVAFLVMLPLLRYLLPQSLPGMQLLDAIDSNIAHMP
jgi:hypothetical protein